MKLEKSSQRVITPKVQPFNLTQASVSLGLDSAISHLIFRNYHVEMPDMLAKHKCLFINKKGSACL